MKHIILAAALLAPVAAYAQSTPPTQEQVSQGFREQILAQFQDAANLRAQLIAAQARIATLEAAAKPAPKTETPAADATTAAPASK